MAKEIRIIEVKPRPLAVVRVTTALAQWPKQFRESLDKVYEAVKAGQVSPHGHNVMVYRPRADSLTDIECGIETAGSFEPAGEVVFAQTPTGIAVNAVHVGPYEKLSTTHKAITEWAAENGHVLTGVRWEIYGDWDANPANLRTEIFATVK